MKESTDVENQDSKKNLSEEDKDMIVNEISLVIQNIISFFSSKHLLLNLLFIGSYFLS